MGRGMDTRARQRQSPRNAGVDAAIHKGVVPFGEKGGDGRKICLISAGEKKAFVIAEIGGKGLPGIGGDP